MKKLNLYLGVLLFAIVALSSCSEREIINEANPVLHVDEETVPEIYHEDFGTLKLGEGIAWEDLNPEVRAKYQDRMKDIKKDKPATNRNCPWWYYEANFSANDGSACMHSNACGGFQYRCGSNPWALVGSIDLNCGNAWVDISGSSGTFYTLGYSQWGIHYVDSRYQSSSSKAYQITSCGNIIRVL